MDLRRRFSAILPLRMGYWAALTLVLGFVCYSMVDLGGQSKRARMRGELDRILQENQLLDRQNLQMVLEVDALKNRWDYLEKVAREDLGLVRKGELIYQIASQTAPQTPQSTIQGTGRQPAPSAEPVTRDGSGQGRDEDQIDP